ncbi:MAG: hypothetical protein JNJ88_06945 [Planctomycetes bacterium]|nr:hypothetical protein [Planctomycetota bacterium]
MSRFGLLLDGAQIGAFEVLAVGEGSAARNVQAHELTHNVQQGGGAEKQPAAAQWRNIPLKGGSMHISALLKLKAPAGRRLSIVAISSGARVTLMGTRVTRNREQSKGGNDVAIEEIVLQHEGLDL